MQKLSNHVRATVRGKKWKTAILRSRPERVPLRNIELVRQSASARLFAQDFFSDQKPDERVLPSACEKIACTESIKLAWPALKHGLDELYVAVSLGKRTSILAQLKQIVPQFTNTGCDQPGSVVGVVRELHEVPPLVDRSELPFEPRR